MFTHGFDDTLDDDDCKIACEICKKGTETIAVKIRLEPTTQTPEQRVHPGYDWFFVIEGRVRLLLGEREIIVETGEAAEFATMTPHAWAAGDGPAELIMIFDRDGQRAHVHHEPVT